MLQGKIGDGDGWVEWDVKDNGMSYLPSLSCGHFALVWEIGEGIVSISANFYDTDHDPNVPWEVVCDWKKDSVVAACMFLAERLEHPSVMNVVLAATALWEALNVYAL